MTNIYWPVYKNLESEVLELSYSIHIDDKQLNVYSPKISDLILRASAEIESISKELYKNNGGKKKKKIKFDADALEHLDKIWELNKKIVLISSPSCFQSERELRPFLKNEKSTFHGKLTYSWNNSYQNLKHDRANSLEFGSIKYLFDIMAALYLLNIYYKDEFFELQNDQKATRFPINLGSNIFSIKLDRLNYNGKGEYRKNKDFDECTYCIKMADSTIEKFISAQEKMQKKGIDLLLKHPKFQEYISKNDINSYEVDKNMWDILGMDEASKIMQQSAVYVTEVIKIAQYEGVLNKNQF